MHQEVGILRVHLHALLVQLISLVKLLIITIKSLLIIRTSLTSHLLIIKNLSIQGICLHTLRELVYRLLELLQHRVDSAVVPNGGGCPVVRVQLLHVGHGEVRLKSDGLVEVHNGLVDLVYEEMYLKENTEVTIMWQLLSL